MENSLKLDSYLKLFYANALLSVSKDVIKEQNPGCTIRHLFKTHQECVAKSLLNKNEEDIRRECMTLNDSKIMHLNTFNYVYFDCFLEKTDDDKILDDRIINSGRVDNSINLTLSLSQWVNTKKPLN